MLHLDPLDSAPLTLRQVPNSSGSYIPPIPAADPPSLPRSSSSSHSYISFLLSTLRHTHSATPTHLLFVPGDSPPSLFSPAPPPPPTPVLARVRPIPPLDSGTSRSVLSALSPNIFSQHRTTHTCTPIPSSSVLCLGHWVLELRLGVSSPSHRLTSIRVASSRGRIAYHPIQVSLEHLRLDRRYTQPGFVSFFLSIYLAQRSLPEHHLLSVPPVSAG